MQLKNQHLKLYFKSNRIMNGIFLKYIIDKIKINSRNSRTQRLTCSNFFLEFLQFFGEWINKRILNFLFEFGLIFLTSNNFTHLVKVIDYYKG